MMRLTILFTFIFSMLGLSSASAEPFQYTKDDVECLAQNIYFEAGNQSAKGKQAVAYVTLNRVNSNDYPDAICDVVKQAKHSRWHQQNTGKLVPIRHKCQFSWYCDGKADIIRDADTYKESLIIALQVLHRYPARDITFGATHYHATYVNPSWSRVLANIITIEDHIFYK